MLRTARQDELELAAAIRLGAERRPVQAYGNYFEGRRSSCALGAAYEGMYRLPEVAESLRPRHLERLFDCLENTIRACPEGCRKRLPLGPLLPAGLLTGLLLHRPVAFFGPTRPFALGTVLCPGEPSLRADRPFCSRTRPKRNHRGQARTELQRPPLPEERFDRERDITYLRR